MPNRKTVSSLKWEKEKTYQLAKKEFEELIGSSEAVDYTFKDDEDIEHNRETGFADCTEDINYGHLSVATSSRTSDILSEAPPSVKSESELVADAAAFLTKELLRKYDADDTSDDEDSSDSDINEDSGEEEEEEEEEEGIREFLQVWSVKYKIANNALDSLLAFLKPHHPSLPLSAKTLKGTPIKTNLKLLNNGQYSHIGLQKGLLQRLEKGFVEKGVTKVLVDVFVDGVKLYNSPNAEAWPIMARCADLKDDKPFVVGIFYGKGKPNPIEDYLAD